jgi:glutamyl-tRNA reductase
MRTLGERDSVTPTIAALQQRAEQLRRDEVERTLRRSPELDESARERIDVMTQSLMRKLLHAPIARLRESDGDPALALTIREVFDLDA